MNIEGLISKAAGEAVKALYGMEASEKMLQLQKTRSEFEGNLTLVVFPFVKAAKKSPEQTAQTELSSWRSKRPLARPSSTLALPFR